MSNEFVPRKAEKRRVKLKIAIQGPSGSGKTWGALSLARNMWPEAKICVIDTENESASLYADRFEFDTIPLREPFTTERYIHAIDAAIGGGYDVVIVDSITPQWDGVGGILRRKEDLDKRPGTNSYANWATFTPEHEQFKQKLVQSPIHLIATMRSKQEYALERDEKGKSRPVKLGMSPIQRDNMDFEFSVVWDTQMDHRCCMSKNRTGLFEGEVVNLADPAVAKKLRMWLENGKEEVKQPEIKKPEVSQTEKKDGFISTDKQAELDGILKAGRAKGLDTKQFSSYLQSIGYVRAEGRKPIESILESQFERAKEWLVTNSPK